MHPLLIVYNKGTLKTMIASIGLKDLHTFNAAHLTVLLFAGEVLRVRKQQLEGMKEDIVLLH